MSLPTFDVDGVSLQDSIANLLQSIAMEEAGLSHIINAEGEKIQKCVEKACSCNDLLKVNESVTETLKTVTKLQLVLQFKLEEVAKIKNDHKHKSCDDYFKED